MREPRNGRKESKNVRRTYRRGFAYLAGRRSSLSEYESESGLGGGLGTGRSHGGLGGASNAGSPYANYVGGGGQDLQQRWRRENGLESMAMAPW